MSGLLDNMQATPRKRLLGLLADGLQGAHDFVSKPFGYPNPPAEMLSNLVGVPAVARTLDRVSYGEPLTTGSGWTTKMRPDTVDAAMAVAPIAAKFPRATAGAAMGLLGAADTGAGRAIFIGAKAKTWNAAKAAKAKAMEAAGKDARTIWQETGTFKGADGHWRQEISDEASRVNIGRVPQFGGTQAQSGLVGDAMQHRRLFDAYPDLNNIELSISGSDTVRDSAAYMRGGGRIPENIALDRKSAQQIAARERENFNSVKQDIADGLDSDWLLNNFGGDKSLVDAFNKKQLSEYGRKAELTGRGLIPDRGEKSDLLHELQHAVQQREGWAKGGSPFDFTQQTEAELARDALSWAKELQAVKRKHPGIDTSAAENKVVQQYSELGAMDFMPSRDARDLARQPGVLFPDPNGYQQASDLEELVRMYGLDKRTTPYTGQEGYKRLAGEAEARAAQARMNMTAQERLSKFPFDSYDVPVDSLIVRGVK